MLDVNRTAYRYEPIRLPDEDETRADIVDKACNYGRVGYRMVTNMMRNEGKIINHKRVEHGLPPIFVPSTELVEEAS